MALKMGHSRYGYSNWFSLSAHTCTHVQHAKNKSIGPIITFLIHFSSHTRWSLLQIVVILVLRAASQVSACLIEAKLDEVVKLGQVSEGAKPLADKWGGASQHFLADCSMTSSLGTPALIEDSMNPSQRGHTTGGTDYHCSPECANTSKPSRVIY